MITLGEYQLRSGKEHGTRDDGTRQGPLGFPRSRMGD